MREKAAWAAGSGTGWTTGKVSEAGRGAAGGAGDEDEEAEEEDLTCRCLGKGGNCSIHTEEN